MFEAKLLNVQLWQGTINSLAGTIEEGIFRADEKGMTLFEFDQSRICAGHIDLPQSFFKDGSYVCPEPVKFKVALDPLKKVNAFLKQDDIVTIRFDPTHPRLEIRVPERNWNASLVTLKIDEDDDHTRTTLDELHLDLQNALTLSPEIFEMILNCAVIFGEDLTIEAIPTKGFRFSIDGECGTYEHWIPDEKVTTKSEAIYKISYFTHFLAGCQVDKTRVIDRVILEFAHESPLKFTLPLEYFVGKQGLIRVGTLMWILAQKVEGSEGKSSRKTEKVSIKDPDLDDLDDLDDFDEDDDE